MVLHLFQRTHDVGHAVVEPDPVNEPSLSIWNLSLERGGCLHFEGKEKSTAAAHDIRGANVDVRI